MEYMEAQKKLTDLEAKKLVLESKNKNNSPFISSKFKGSNSFLINSPSPEKLKRSSRVSKFNNNPK